MDDKKSSDRKFTRKSLGITLLPLFVGLTVSIVFTIALVAFNYSKWLDNAEEYILANKVLAMQSLAMGVALQVQGVFTEAFIENSMITGMYQGVVDGNIRIYDDLPTPIYKNIVENLKQDFPDLNSAVWLSGTSETSLKKIEKYIYALDPFLRIVLKSFKNLNQIGVIIEKGEFQYMFPSIDMSFTQGWFDYTSTCGRQLARYSPICTKAYSALLKTNNTHPLYYFEFGQLNILYKFKYGALLAVTSEDFIISRVNPIKDYRIFVSDSNGSYALFVDDLLPMKFYEKNLADVLYSTTKAREDFTAKVIPSMGNPYSSLVVDIDAEQTLFILLHPNISINSQVISNYIVGISHTGSNLWRSFEDFTQAIILSILFQLIIFVIFFLITLLALWKCSYHIFSRVMLPINEIFSYLSTKDPQLSHIHKSSSQVVNLVLSNLKYIENIEFLLEPELINSSNLEVRERVLDKLKALYSASNNKRSKSIIRNLLGNLEFQKKDFYKAEHHYLKALALTEEIFAEIKDQENEQKELKHLRQDMDAKKSWVLWSWEEERESFAEKISERLRQVCMATRERLREQGYESISARESWIGIIEMQTKVLQYYEARTGNFSGYLRLLLDMAEAYYRLDHCYNANKLLQIIEEDLFKLESNNNLRLNVDVNRLNGIGINITRTKVKSLRQQPEVFNKDLLKQQIDLITQRMLYIRALVSIKNQNYYFAATDLALALGHYEHQFAKLIHSSKKNLLNENLRYYDPEVRDACLQCFLDLTSKLGLQEEFSKVYYK